MHELALVLGTIVAVGAIGLVTTWITPSLMTQTGLAVLLAGLFVGLPTGFWYHVALYRTLAQKTSLPPKWWWSPVDLHPRLAADELARIRPWFVAGGIGFGLSILGSLAVMAGLLLSE